MIVCPSYQLPSRSSQIYTQAGARSVCIGTYTHLAVMARYAELTSQAASIAMMRKVFQSVEAMNPSKSASVYWQTVNSAILDFDEKIRDIWKEEKLACLESIQISKNEALQFLASKREGIMKLSREEAIREVLKANKITNKISAIESVTDNGILNLHNDE